MLLCHLTVSAKPLCSYDVPYVVHSSGQILLPRYLMNGLNSFDDTDKEYSLVLAGDLITFWKSKVKVTADRRGREPLERF